MANPYQRPSWKDPRPSAQESASALSSYFQDQATKRPQVSSPYSAPAEPAGSSASVPSASSAPKSAAGGGTGFVSFGQYFGANAPAIQQQAQQQGARMEAFGPARQSGSMEAGAFDQLLGGGSTKRESEKQGRYGFKQLDSRIGQAAGERAVGQAKESAYQQWLSDQPTQYRYNFTPEELRATFEDQWNAGTYREKTPGMVSTPGSSL